MGCDGALVRALRDPSRWLSVSAFAPICHPVAVPWGKKAFPRYLGADEGAWARWDASLLMRQTIQRGATVLLDAEVKVACVTAADFRPRAEPDALVEAMIERDMTEPE